MKVEKPALRFTAVLLIISLFIPASLSSTHNIMPYDFSIFGSFWHGVAHFFTHLFRFHNSTSVSTPETTTIFTTSTIPTSTTTLVTTSVATSTVPTTIQPIPATSTTTISTTTHASTTMPIQEKYTPLLEFTHECSNYTYSNSISCTTSAEIISKNNQLTAGLFLNNKLVNITNITINDTESEVGAYTYLFATPGNANYSDASITYTYVININPATTTISTTTTIPANQVAPPSNPSANSTCLPTAGYECTNPIYWGGTTYFGNTPTGNILVTIGQLSSQTYYNVALEWVPTGTTSLSNGVPNVAFGFAGYPAIEGNMLTQSHSAVIMLNATGPVSIGSTASGTLWMAYDNGPANAPDGCIGTAHVGSCQYVSIGSLNLTAK